MELPKSNRFDYIIVVGDQLTHIRHLIPCTVKIIVQELENLLLTIFSNYIDC
jgi:hypothetical protein